MDVARVARLLWQQAGAQPGRYAEYWTKVEQCLTEARHTQALRALAERPLFEPESADVHPREAGEPAQTIATIVWGATAWEQDVLCHEAEDLPATDAAGPHAPRRDR